VEEADSFLNQGCTVEVGRLPKRVMLYIDPGPWGHVAEWLRNGLQNRVHQFNSGRGLQLNPFETSSEFNSRSVPEKRFATISFCGRG
jgi:hypothetical protein